jgi:hypothetical protein
MSQSFYARAQRGFAAAVVGAGIACFALTAQAADSPFEGLAGPWTGNGTIAMTNGSSERLHCRVSYEIAPSGLKLSQKLTCASDSYKFQVQSRVIASGAGELTGTWREITRGAEGNVSGSVAGGEIRAHVDGTGFTADLSIRTKGDRQSVVIRPQGADVREVTVELRRS